MVVGGYTVPQMDGCVGAACGRDGNKIFVCCCCYRFLSAPKKKVWVASFFLVCYSNVDGLKMNLFSLIVVIRVDRCCGGLVGGWMRLHAQRLG